jgi:hypothetical protein
MLYAVHGLRLISSFPLPGMPAAAGAIDGLPSLTLALRSPTELEQAWSGAGGQREWRGRMGDGNDLVIEWGAGGDLLFTYGDLARFRLDRGMRRLDCVPRGPGLGWQRVLIGKVIPSVSVMRGYEALHAAAVDSPDGVVAIMAPSGAEKSTLALELLRRGWPLFADDVLTLSQVDGEVRAHPGPPHMNIAQPPQCADLRELGTPLAVLAGELWLTARARAEQMRPVRMLCLLGRGPQLPLEIHALPPNPMLLAPYMLGLSGGRERQDSRFFLYANLTEWATLVRIIGGPEHRPAQLADLIEQALTREAQPAGADVR